jgi:5-methylcytosine-specific restriction endonuclease McrA
VTNAERMQRNRDEHKKKGLCISCPKAAMVGKTQCADCLERRSKESLASSRKRVKNGLCYDCSGRATVGKYCLHHWFSKVSSFKSTGTRRNGEPLKKMFYARGGKCAYTGIALIPGSNASVDHKIPRSRGGPDTIDNLQWVDSRINRMKTDMAHEEFLETCALVLSRDQL